MRNAQTRATSMDNWPLNLNVAQPMDALIAYSSSDEEDEKSQKPVEINPDESAKVVSKLKERFPLNSAPTVLGKVGIN